MCAGPTVQQVLERIIDFGDKVFALAGGVDAQMVSRRNLAERLELGALPLVHLWGSV